ncbi:Protein prenyltransferase [Macrophomina phaseolina MS6]|uniref:Protein prenyltransferase n=1 Tax=Macrophomina phaseolina (strain MS6) TaxID=1126212 RepID=K2SAK8_MACPH|nr:Protein prenyltransferase [Macrophomina phaseolina MS6]
MATTKWGPRPLDPKHQLAYAVLNKFFTRHQEDVVEIEVLPPALAPPDGSVTLEDGLCIGVPKRVLAAAFVAACSIFFENRDEPNESSVLAALDATRVILLFDPEHLTAANFRRLQLEEVKFPGQHPYLSSTSTIQISDIVELPKLDHKRFRSVVLHR